MSAIEAPGEAVDPVTLRAAARDDALCLSVLGMQVYLDTYAPQGIRPAIARDVLASFSTSAFEAALADADSRTWVAECAGHLVGFAQLSLGARHELAPAGVQAELLRLYVQEPFTGRQVGSALLAQAESGARAAGASVIWLTPWVRNQRALAFYARRGYQDRGLTHYLIEGEAHENRVCAKQLPSQSDTEDARVITG